MSRSLQINWLDCEKAPADFLGQLPGVHPLVMQVLWARGLRDAATAGCFLADVPDDADPFALPDMRIAVDRILRAIGGGEPIAVYGDYDCDGVTACALLNDVLSLLKANARIYIPDRFEEGYGLNSAALDRLKADGVGLVVTVDCGARAMGEARHAREIGLDLVVTDHHELEDGEIPDACAVINPRRSGSIYPFKFLAGVGVAYRLAQALLRSAADPGAGAGQAAPSAYEETLLDLVAIGTVADVVPLIGENRCLVRAGLRRINTQPRLGVRHLAAAASVKIGTATAQSIGFAMGPRLNAAGRIETARDAFDLLTVSDESIAHQIAGRLNQRNDQRQQITASVARSAEHLAFVDGDSPLLFAASEDYNPGVIGLAAARLVEKFYRPAIVVSTHMGEARGSCRSVEGFHITAALDQCKDLLARHGGHAAAAGFSTPAVSLAELHKRLVEIAAAQQPDGGWARALPVDAEINLYKLSMETYTQLQRLEPHGMGNPRPNFAARGAILYSIRRVGKVHPPAEGAAPEQPPHLQLRLKDAKGASWEAIGWRMGERAPGLALGAKIDVLFQLDINEWNGESKLQLVIQDLRVVQ